jgi:muramidase (phage lysozyme)
MVAFVLERGVAGSLDGSVGLDGFNRPEDVAVVQKLLKSKNYYGESRVDGRCGTFTVQAIKKFQEKYTMQNPDGLIQPGKKTWQKLIHPNPIPRTGHPASAITTRLAPAVMSPRMSIEERRVRAFLRMLRVGEGTVGPEGYSRLFGGSSFISQGRTYNDHPQIIISAGRYKSSAAGAYQVMGYTWTDPAQVALRKKYSINDFAPKSQDRYCVVLIKHKRRALGEIMTGDIAGAINKCNKEWASLPGSPYGQPTISLEHEIRKFGEFLAEESEGKSDLAVQTGELADLLQ